MSKINMKDVWKGFTTGVSNHAPALLIGASAAAFITTVIFAVKATPKAVKHIEEKKKELGKEKLTFKETIRACGKDYIPAVISGVVATGASIGAAVCAEKEHKVAAGALTALTMSEKTIDDLREATKEVVGKTKAADIDAKVAEKRVQNDIRTGVNNYPALEPGQMWFRDEFTGQSFIARPGAVDKAIAIVNENGAYGDCFITVPDLIDEYQQVEIGNRLITPNMEYLGWGHKIKWHPNPVNIWDDHGNLIGVVTEIRYEDLPTTRERADCYR